jgi:hypothetical protein
LPPKSRRVPTTAAVSSCQRVIRKRPCRADGEDAGEEDAGARNRRPMPSRGGMPLVTTTRMPR